MGGAKGEDKFVHIVGRFLEFWGGVRFLSDSDFLQRFRVEKNVGQCFVIDVALDEMEILKCCFLGLLKGVKTTLIQTSMGDGQRLKGRMREDVNVFLKIPISTSLTVVIQRA